MITSTEEFLRLLINIGHVLIFIPLAWLAWDFLRECRRGKNGLTMALLLVTLSFLANEAWSIAHLTASLFGYDNQIVWTSLRVMTIYGAAVAIGMLFVQFARIRAREKRLE